VKVVDYWTIVSIKTKLNRNWKLYWNLGGALGVVGKPSGTQI
jgi:hypothetical protein